MLKKINFIIISIIIGNTIHAQQYLVLQAKNGITINTQIRSTKKLSNKIINVNCLSNDLYDKTLIHAVVFSNIDGYFSKKTVTEKELKNLNCIYTDSAFKLAIRNTQLDQNREISFFEFENNQPNFFVQSNSFYIVLENTDHTFTVYEDIALTFFYAIKNFKQFTPFQTCASVINTNAIKNNITRNQEVDFEPTIEFSSDSLSDYLPNKIFLEKENFNGTYHFVKFKQLCHDCSNNYNFEFDYDPNIGITNFWYYLPKSLSKKDTYLRFGN